MQKLHFSIKINAPKEKVWHTMLDDKTYREWTATFMPGSHFEGSWDKGSKIRFVASDNKGQMGGMLSQIAENRPYEFLSIHHLGLVSAGAEDTESEEAKKWAGAQENYTFKETDGVTELIVDTDVTAEMKEEMEQGWLKALDKLKELAEK